jgi:hypothetical protein
VGKFIPVEPKKWAKMVKAMAENARLKAEVERLTKHEDDTCRHYIMRLLLESQNARLKAEVERLTKAGDRVLHTLLWTDEYDEFRYKDAKKIWDAAKEGKQS